MMHPRVAVLSRPALLLLFTACVDWSTTPGGGGQNSDGRVCWSDVTAAWTSNSLSMTVTAPPCPFTVRSTSDWIAYAARFKAPSNRITFEYAGGPVRSYVTAYVLNRFGAQTIAYDGFNYFYADPGNSSVYLSDASADGVPGTYLISGSSYQMQDSLDAQAAFMVSSGIAKAWYVFGGNVTSQAQSVVGPTAVATGQSETWRSYPHWDTTAYTYKWLVDGAVVSGATGATLSTSLAPGTHTVSSVTIRTDNTRDSITIVVKAYTATISGPSNVKSGATCSWSASASDGTAPYAYTWQAPGASGSGEYFDYTNGVAAGGQFTIVLTAQDAAGAAITKSKTVNVSSSAPTCTF